MKCNQKLWMHLFSFGFIVVFQTLSFPKENAYFLQLLSKQLSCVSVMVNVKDKDVQFY